MSNFRKIKEAVDTEVKKSRDTTALTIYDLTIPRDEKKNQKEEVEEICSFFRQHCSRWCFQLEAGKKKGHLHYQCRISILTRRRLDTMIKWCQKQPILNNCHVSPTSGACAYTGNELYVMKEDTRVDGPYSDRNTVNMEEVPSHYKIAPVWWPWQQEILKIIESKPDGEKVNVILNPSGGQGKTHLASYLSCRKMAHRVPIMEHSKDIMRAVMCMKKENKEKNLPFFIDFPRAISKNVSKQFASAIEEITNGFAYDDRYKWTEAYFEKPHVFVFTNNIIDENLLTGRRWNFYTIVGKNSNGRLLKIQEQYMAFEPQYTEPIICPVLNILNCEPVIKKKPTLEEINSLMEEIDENYIYLRNNFAASEVSKTTEETEWETLTMKKFLHLMKEHEWVSAPQLGIMVN